MRSLWACMILAGFALSTAAESPSSTTTEPKNGTAGGDTTSVPKSAPAEVPKVLELTIEQLAKYNGQDGQPAYIAVDGVIYDVTNAKGWKKGKHKGYKAAGTDATKLIKKDSPHGLKVLKNDPVVGKLVASPPAAPAK